MNSVNTRVCPVENAGSLDNVIRRWLQNPLKILSPYIQPGMTVMDFGCGPGFFTVHMAQMVGPSGQVIAVDLQEGMLQKLCRKIRDTEIEPRIRLHCCQNNRIGLAAKIDFVLAFYVVHEIPDQGMFYRELDTLLKPNGVAMLVEPPFHVSRSGFEQSLGKAREAGFEIAVGPRILLSKSAILIKPSQTKHTVSKGT